MDAPNVWVAKHDGSDIVRATAIVGVGIDYNGNITARLGHGEGATVTLADPGRQHGDHPGGIFTASWSVSLPSYPTHPEPSWCGRYVMRCMAGNGSPNLFDFLSALRFEGWRFPPDAASRGGFLLRCAAPGLVPVLPALRRPSLPARRPWRRSLITVTRDGSGDSGRDQRTGTSPILGSRSFPQAAP